MEAVPITEAAVRAGLLDADIDGPSVPLMLGPEDRARQIRMTPDRKIQPLEAHGLAVVSFGFFLGPQLPAVWRGPMVSKAVKQFSRGVLWPEPDVLVVSLPPGTGDMPLSLAQTVVVDGGVVVTTPQRLRASVAPLRARRGTGRTAGRATARRATLRRAGVGRRGVRASARAYRPAPTPVEPHTIARGESVRALTHSHPHLGAAPAPAPRLCCRCWCD